MSALDIWLTILALAVATILTRTSFFVLGSVRLPARLQHALRYAPATALAAILVPDLVLVGSTAEFSLLNPKLLAAVAASVFFLLTRHLLGTIVFGMLAFTGLRLVL